MCESRPLPGYDPPRLPHSWLAGQVHIKAHQADASANYGAKGAVFQMQHGPARISIRVTQKKGLRLRHAHNRSFRAHVQPAIDAVGLGGFSGYAPAFLIENVNCAPHAETVRAYSA